MSLPSLPLFVAAAGRPVMLLGEGPAADAKRRLLERAGAVIAGEDGDARIAIVAIEDETAAEATVARLKARGILVNAVDRPALCDFTIPAIVDRDPVMVAIGTGGASAALAAALRQWLEAVLPTALGRLARRLHAARAAIRTRFPAAEDRRRALSAALAPGGALDPLVSQSEEAVAAWLAGTSAPAEAERVTIRLRSADPDDLTLREARWLANADRVIHHSDVPSVILERARADAERIVSAAAVVEGGRGLTVVLEMAS